MGQPVFCEIHPFTVRANPLELAEAVRNQAPDMLVVEPDRKAARTNAFLGSAWTVRSLLRQHGGYWLPCELLIEA
jgi:hypothetical protein